MKYGEIWVICLLGCASDPHIKHHSKLLEKKHLPEANMFAPENPGLESMHFLLGTGPVAGAKNKWVVSGSVASDQQIVV